MKTSLANDIRPYKWRVNQLKIAKNPENIEATERG